MIIKELRQRKEMLGSLNRHYSNIEDNKPLDPMFKDKFFSSLVKSLDAKMQLE